MAFSRRIQKDAKVAMKDLERLRMIKNPVMKGSRVECKFFILPENKEKNLRSCISKNVVELGCRTDKIDDCIKNGITDYLRNQGIDSPRRLFYATKMYHDFLKSHKPYYSFMKNTLKETCNMMKKLGID